MFPLLAYDDKRPVDIICMGRVAVDLYSEQIGSSLAEASSFKKYLGGCAGNIAVGCARLGLRSSMFSCVGSDDMGLFLRNELEKEGVLTELLYQTPDHLTGLVLLGVKPPRDFPLIFYRNDCADMQLQASQISEAQMLQSKALLITGTGFSTQAMYETSMAVIGLAKKSKTLVIFDLDYRPVLWGLKALGDGETRYCADRSVTDIYQRVLPFCDLVVGTEEEFCIASGKDSPKEALEVVSKYTKAPLVVKAGEKGCTVYFPAEGRSLMGKPFPVEVLNVLGAGDGFMSGLLAGLLQGADWDRATTYANACGALVVTRHGCAPAIPYKEELEYFISEFASNPRVWAGSYLARMHDRHQEPGHIRHPEGFAKGLNPILVSAAQASGFGMNLYSLKLDPGEIFVFSKDYEFAALLMTGRAVYSFANQSREVLRMDYFSESPIVLHCPAGQKASVHALTCCEILLMETPNSRVFEPMLFDKDNLLECDQRGKGLLDDASFRLVRTVFDKRNRPESNLVVGEIISFQGRWSSYPSHYHDQPEIYHYRFSEPAGYAFGEKGEEVLRIQHNDTYCIPSGLRHAHCTAPGYALYTLWFIRHLPDNPYHEPTFCEAHEWTRKPAANTRVWREKDSV